MQSLTLKNLKKVFILFRHFGFFQVIDIIKAKLSTNKKISYVNLKTVVFPSFFSAPTPSHITDIVIPIYNGYEFLPSLFESLKRSTDTKHRLIVLNDCSSDEQVDLFLKDIEQYKNVFCQDLILVHNLKNLGFVQTINSALPYIQNHFVILNTDVELPMGWLQRLMYPIENDVNIASTTPFTNSGTICSFPNWLQDNTIPFGLSVDKVDEYFKYLNPKNNMQIPTGVGFCMGINKHVVDKIGLFDAETFGKGYGEENDWCMRAQKVGYEHIHVVNLYVYHKHGGSFGEQKQQLVTENHQKLLIKHPHYELLIQKFIERNKLNELRDSLFLKIVSDNVQQLIFDHGLGGGATKFYKENLLKEAVNSLVVFGKMHSKDVFMVYYEGLAEIKTWCCSSLAEFFNFADFSSLKEVHVNHLLTIMELKEVIHFLSKTTARKYYYQHDFINICPTYNLLNQHGNFCGVPKDIEVCNQCQVKNIYSLRNDNANMKLDKWRVLYENILSLCEVIFCFSQDSKSHLLKVYPAMVTKIIVKPHTLKNIEKIVDTVDFTENDVIHVGVLGGINYAKGLDVIKSLAQKKLFSSKIFKLTVIGNIYSLPIKNVLVTGEYKSVDLISIVRKHKIDLFIIPSIWAETFCYTADEIMHLGYPLIVFNIGAPPERVRNYPKGFVVDEISAEAMMNKILEVSTKFGFKLSL
jgi:GT2 family glycosyltransferase